MKYLFTATTAIAAPLGICAASAQESALAENSVRPMEITCADIMGASEAERSGLVFFIAGYRAATDQMGLQGSMAASNAADNADNPPDANNMAAAPQEAQQSKPDVVVPRSFMATGVSEILKGCEGNEAKVAAHIIGTAAGWPEPAADTQPGTPEGNQ